MNVRRASKLFVPCVLAVLLAGCGALETSTPDAKAKNKGKGKGGGPVPVVTAVAHLKDVPIEIQVVGNVEPYSTVSVRAQVSGQLTNVLLKDGDFVKKGDPLFTIDSRQIDGQLAQAEANLARSNAQLTQAEANLARDSAQESYSRLVADRNAQLVQDGIMSKDQGQQSRANADALAQSMAADRAAIQSARAQILADQAAIQNIRLQKTYTAVSAPIDGRTGNVTQKLGNIVTANNTELASIQQVQPIYVAFAVPEGRLNEIKSYFDKGGKLPVTTHPQGDIGNGNSAVSERGELTFIDSSVDMSTGTIRLKGTFTNVNRTLWPGQFVNVTMQLTTRRGAVVVPNQAVQTGQDGTFVYVVDADQKVSFRPVKVGPRVDLEMVIDEGLKAGETVVTEGQLRLQPGSVVQTGGNGRGGGRGKSDDAQDASKDGVTKDASKDAATKDASSNNAPGKDPAGKGDFTGKEGFKGKGKRSGPGGA